MSHAVDETYAVYDERHPRARKAHRCDACGEPVAAGQRYWRIGIVFDREGETVKRCERCQTIHVHLRGLMDQDEWPDERLRCGHEYAELHGEDPPPEIAALAFATAEEMQR